MAEPIKISFATLNPGSGNGDQAVAVTGDRHTGRLQRSVTVSVATADSSISKDVVINQQAADEFVTIDETASLDKSGGTITVNGKSNSTKLKFELTPGDPALELTIPETYMAGGAATANDTEISGDPGATSEYNFSITFTDIAANETVASLTDTLKVTAAGGQTDSCVITQTAGDPTLEVEPTEITLNANGDEQTLNITSNTSWTITQKVSAAFAKMFKK